jgi:hypothetical protein
LLTPAEDIDPQAARALALIAKVLQTLANRKRDFLEDYMKPAEAFLLNNSERMAAFYDTISVWNYSNTFFCPFLVFR